MTLIVLPHDVRSLLCASAQINNYKTAVEELTYNSLDAGSTSIAIRIHIQENTIQVIDNGNGIVKTDFEALGQRHLTSKLIDLSTLKSVPNYYGYRGEFLANLAEICLSVKIISRHKHEEETWAKTFLKGKNQQIVKTTMRPSKGTTVEVKGFLYNLNIQKQGINSINELQNIKTFLEQLSLVHDNISLSLRDESKNEIVFKIHKKRDIYQTLLTLYNIERNIVQELHVVKNQYKVRAFIGKTDIDIGKYWVYLNGKFVQRRSKIHKIMNEYLKKYLLIKDKKSSKLTNNHDEDHLFKQNIPFYFLFISCPYVDYDMNSSLRQSVIEFKNWKQINKMLEKLIKFYVGDIKVTEINVNKTIIKQPNNKRSGGTRDQIKKIVDKILGSNSTKIGVSQLQNGVKGKLIQKRNKNKITKEKVVNRSSKIGRQAYCAFGHDKPLSNFIQNIHCDNKHEKSLIKEDTLSKDNKYFIHEDNGVAGILEENKIRKLLSFKLNRSCQRCKIGKDNKNSNRKPNNVSPTKMIYKMTRNESKVKPIKNKKHKQRHNNVSHLLEGAVPSKSKCVAKEAETLLTQRNDPIFEEKNKNMRINTTKRKQRYSDCIKYRISPETNKRTTANYVMNRIRSRPFKTTYDLVQTILQNQQDTKFNESDQYFEERFKEYPAFDHRQISCINPKLPLQYMFSNYSESDYKHVQKSNNTSQYLASYTFTCENTNSINKYINYKAENSLELGPHVELRQPSLRCEDIFREYPDELYTQNAPDRLTNILTAVTALTYESHNYNKDVFDAITDVNINKDRYVYKPYGLRFISKNSEDNFITTDNKHEAMYKNKYKRKSGRRCNVHTKYFGRHLKQSDESYRIEFTENNNKNSNESKFSIVNIDDKTHLIYKPHLPDYERILTIGNTYTISNYSNISSFNKSTQHQSKQNDCNELIQTTSILYYSNTESKNYDIVNTITKDSCDLNNINIVFVSNPQCSNNEMNLDDVIEPINVCETVFNENESIKEYVIFNSNKTNKFEDSLHSIVFNNNNTIKNNVATTTYISKNKRTPYNSNSLAADNLTVIDNIKDKLIEPTTSNGNENNDTDGRQTKLQDVERHDSQNNKDNNHTSCKINENSFNFKDRLRFLPKGMSQIFEKCGSKATCSYNLKEDYYEDVIYNDFANDVQMQTETYEPVIQNVETQTTKDVHKFQQKVHKDNASLVFDQESLKKAQVLRQVDCKFIAAIMREKYRESKEPLKYLVLFDQHAVHERIRLENNLAGYLNENQWISTPLDNVTLKMSKDEVLYLHNYKEKFNQLGLQWNILNKDEILVTGIPEAILGKYPREVDKVMKAVKNLIVEEINIIKLQKGCISLYPKSIMDLVFSEACRYAIKFGDKLLQNDCIRLLNDLSKCKTPFQCAHGRPVIAVLVNVQSVPRDYKINIASLKSYNLNSKKNI